MHGPQPDQQKVKILPFWTRRFVILGTKPTKVLVDGGEDCNLLKGFGFGSFECIVDPPNPRRVQSKLYVLEFRGFGKVKR